MKNCIFVLDAGGTFLKYALYDANGIIAGSFGKEPVDSDGALNKIKEAYQTALNNGLMFAKANGLEIEAVSVDIPGPFDYKNGISRMKHKYVSLYDIPLRPWFEEVLGAVPVYFMHDATAFINGAVLINKSYQNIAGVMLGTGFGFALTHNQKALLNENDGPLVSVYSRPYKDKIAEDFVSARGIVNVYNSFGIKVAENAKDVADFAEQGDKVAEKVYSDLGIIISDIIAPILKEYKIEALYFGGQISRSFSMFEENLKTGLADVSTLVKIAPVNDIDMVHLDGAARAYYVR